MRRHLLIGALAAAVLAATANASSTQTPLLISAKSVHQHLVLVARFGDLSPLGVRVAARPTTGQDGALLAANVRLSARFVGVQAGSGTKRWRSAHKLKPGVYWAQVSGLETDGVTDCPPKIRNCLTHWSNVRRVALRPLEPLGTRKRGESASSPDCAGD